MTHAEFIEKIKTDFIKNRNYLLIDRLQTVDSPNPALGGYGRTDIVFCEIIAQYSDYRDIIRISGYDVSLEKIPEHLSINLVSLIFKSPNHPNIGTCEFKLKNVFNGEMKSKEDSDEIDFPSLINILEKISSFK